jgi:hypothetical protein
MPTTGVLVFVLLPCVPGQVGDEINVLMAACAWNLRKWLVIATIFLFYQKVLAQQPKDKNKIYSWSSKLLSVNSRYTHYL